ncbi:MAG: DUF433 domain-containing protein [Chloroflexota bacterium]
MNTQPIHLPKSLYDLVSQQAAKRQQTPDGFVQELLSEHLMPSHPYVETVESRSGPRAVIKGTRVGVEIVIGYIQAGYAPQEIVDAVLPQLSLAQVYDALSYYEDHRIVIDQALKENSIEVWRERVRRKTGKAAAQLLGE